MEFGIERRHFEFVILNTIFSVVNEVIEITGGPVTDWKGLLRGGGPV